MSPHVLERRWQWRVFVACCKPFSGQTFLPWSPISDCSKRKGHAYPGTDGILCYAAAQMNLDLESS